MEEAFLPFLGIWSLSVIEPTLVLGQLELNIFWKYRIFNRISIMMIEESSSACVASVALQNTGCRETQGFPHQLQTDRWRAGTSPNLLHANLRVHQFEFIPWRVTPGFRIRSYSGGEISISCINNHRNSVAMSLRTLRRLLFSYIETSR